MGAWRIFGMGVCGGDGADALGQSGLLPVPDLADGVVVDVEFRFW